MGCCDSRVAVSHLLRLQAYPWTKQGHKIMKTPENLVSAVVQATKDAEHAKQDAVYLLEIQRAFVKRNQAKTTATALDIKNVLYDLYRND